MKESGIDISKNKTQSVFTLFVEGNKYDAVITVCEGVFAGKCPIFPGKVKRLAWYFPDPSTFAGTQEEIHEKTRQVRDAINEKVIEFIEEAKDYKFWL